MTVENSPKAPCEKNKLGLRGFAIGMACILLLAFLFSVYWGDRKQVGFIDEFFTYTLSNNEVDMTPPVKNNRWNDQSVITDAMTVRYGEEFSYQKVYRNQVSDVHPPVYYFLVYTVSSFFTGSYSKWIGLSLNIAFLLVGICLVAALAYCISQGDRALSLAAALAYALSPGTMTSVMLIRMYLLLSLFVLLVTILHVLRMQKKISAPVFLILTAFTCFCGFLTQYYFLVYISFLALGYCLYQWIHEKKLVASLCYMAALLLSLGATYLAFPAWVDHIFFGYRGQGAAQGLLALGESFRTIGYYLELANKNAFGGGLWVLLCLLGAGLAYGLVKRKKGRRQGEGLDLKTEGSRRRQGWPVVLMTVASLFYIVMVAVASPTVNWKSCRYMIPVYPVLQVTVLFLSWQVLKGLGLQKKKATAVALAVMMALNVAGFCQGQVLFLAEYHKAEAAYAYQHQNTKVICVHRRYGLFVCMLDELAAYNRVYYMAIDELEGLPAEDFDGAQEVLVYVTGAFDNEPVREYLMSQMPWLDGWEQLPHEESHFNLYRLYHQGG